MEFEYCSRLRGLWIRITEPQLREMLAHIFTDIDKAVTLLKKRGKLETDWERFRTVTDP